MTYTNPQWCLSLHLSFPLPSPTPHHSLLYITPYIHPFTFPSVHHVNNPYVHLTQSFSNNTLLRVYTITTLRYCTNESPEKALLFVLFV